MDLAVPHAHDTRRLEVVADGLPLFGGTQLAIDTTMVSTLHHRDGVALFAARRKKERTYPELIGPHARARLVVSAGEVGGRWSDETLSFLCQLARAKARSEPSRSDVTFSFVSRDFDGLLLSFLSQKNAATTFAAVRAASIQEFNDEQEPGVMGGSVASVTTGTDDLWDELVLDSGSVSTACPHAWCSESTRHSATQNSIAWSSPGSVGPALKATLVSHSFHQIPHAQRCVPLRSRTASPSSPGALASWSNHSSCTVEETKPVTKYPLELLPFLSVSSEI